MHGVEINFDRPTVLAWFQLIWIIKVGLYTCRVQGCHRLSHYHHHHPSFSFCSSSVLHTYLLCLALVTCASICGSSSTTASWAVMSYNSIHRTSTTCIHNHWWIKGELFIVWSTVNSSHVGMKRLLGLPQKQNGHPIECVTHWMAYMYMHISTYMYIHWLHPLP